MAICYTCAKEFAFGGVKDSGYRFCSDSCHAARRSHLAALKLVPQHRADATAQSIRDGRCAKCGGRGKVDFHRSAFVWSALVVTQRRTDVIFGCSGCALKQQALSTAGTLVVGWWGIPWGLVFTPIA